MPEGIGRSFAAPSHLPSSSRMSNTADQLTTLTNKLGLVADLNASATLLEWDQETYMPPGAAEARAQQLATLKTLAHEHFTDAAVGSLLDALDGELDDDTDRALVRVTRRDFDRATKLSADFVARFTRAKARAMEAWKRARAADDFAHFAPHLQEIVDLSVEQAETIGYAERRYDALLDEYEPGHDVGRHRPRVPPPSAPTSSPSCKPSPTPSRPTTRSSTAPTTRTGSGRSASTRSAALGYDFEHGRQDRSAHPFSTSPAITDCRITTRLTPDFFPTGFFGTLHECGHALYELGVDPDARTDAARERNLARDAREPIAAVGEPRRAQPALLAVGLSAPALHFPDELGGVDEAAFYRAINRVQPSPIRVEADEVTYNLHVMLRFELETKLVDGTLAVDDVPEAWNAAMEDLLGFAPASDADGCLQDIHWSLGALGYFPTYTLGTLMSVQLFEAAERDLGDLGAHFAEGEFGPLLGWLREHVHRYGRARTADEILRDATGQSLEPRRGCATPAGSSARSTAWTCSLSLCHREERGIAERRGDLLAAAGRS